MTEPLPDAITRLAAFLAELGAAHALIGGGAIIARVRARATEDLDLLVESGPEQLDRLLEVALRHGYQYEPSERPMFEEGLIRLWRTDGVGLDLIVADSEFLKSAIARATPVDLGVAAIRCVGLEDLLLLKLEAHRGIDIDDLLAIKDAFEATLDMAYLRDRAAELGLADRLALYFGSA